MACGCGEGERRGDGSASGCDCNSGDCPADAGRERCGECAETVRERCGEGEWWPEDGEDSLRGDGAPKAGCGEIDRCGVEERCDGGACGTKERGELGACGRAGWRSGIGDRVRSECDDGDRDARGIDDLASMTGGGSMWSNSRTH